MTLSHRPIPIRDAKRFVGVEHRHLPAPTAARWCLAAYVGAQLVGVAMVGNPKARMSATDPRRQEVVRLATDVTLRHAPTGITVTCRDYSSQFKNKINAMYELRAKVEAAATPPTAPEGQ